MAGMGHVNRWTAVTTMAEPLGSIFKLRCSRRFEATLLPVVISYHAAVREAVH